MAGAGSATILKIIHGTERADRRRDETALAPRHTGRPEIPPFESASSEEKKVFDWIVAEFCNDSMHAKADGLMLLTLTRKLLLLRTCEEKIKQWGPVVLSTTGNPIKSPYCAVADSTSVEIRRTLSALGMSPDARLKLAPLSEGRSASAWEHFD